MRQKWLYYLSNKKTQLKGIIQPSKLQQLLKHEEMKTWRNVGRISNDAASGTWDGQGENI